MKFNNEKLKQLRWQKMLQQKELAAAMGVFPAVVSSWENGRHVPSSEMLMKLSAALGVEPAYFFKTGNP
jgi:transcriptional regulator with XRE-family HTH domain